MTFKPMLAGKCTDTGKLKFPVLCSKKLDGVRASVQGGRLLSRSLKLIPNVNVQKLFKGLPEGTDGELIFGDQCSPTAYRDTVSIVMSDDKPTDGIRYHVFDTYGSRDFAYRLRHTEAAVNRTLTAEGSPVCFVRHTHINNLEELDAYEAAALAEGNEGVMIRSLDGPYKCGRSSEREGYLLKLKRFEDCEAEVTACFELMHNDNEAFTNELGRTARSSHQENKVGTDTLGGFIVRGLNGTYEGVEFRVGTGFDAEQRRNMWVPAERVKLIGRIAKIKYFPTGGKDKPRHPVFLGWRDERDM